MSFLAIVSCDGRPVHLVGPFDSFEAAAKEGGKVADACRMFATVDRCEEFDVRVMQAVASFEALLAGGPR